MIPVMMMAIAVKNTILLNQKKVKIQIKETVKVVQSKIQVTTNPVRPEIVNNAEEN